MRIEWIILAEGITQDARGAFAVVGVNQNVFASPSFPAHTKRAVLTRMEGLEPGQNLTFRVAVTAPSGRVITAQQGQFNVGEQKLPALPAGGLDIPVEFLLSLSEQGAHEFTFELTDNISGETQAKSVELYVITTADVPEEIAPTAPPEA